MTDDRAAFTEARDAGKAKQHEQRLENATYTAVEVKALTKTAADLAYALGRKEAAEEIAAWADDLAAGVINRDKPYNQGFIHASETLARHAREIGTKETP